jgi:hypothetical protein
MHCTFAVTLEVKPEDILSLLSVDQLTESATQVTRLLTSVIRSVREVDLGAPLHALGHGVAQ